MKNDTEITDIVEMIRNGRVDQPVPEPTPAQRSNESLRKLQDIIDSVSRGENAEINEGEYLELSQYLKSLFVT